MSRWNFGRSRLWQQSQQWVPLAMLILQNHSNVIAHTHTHTQIDSWYHSVNCYYSRLWQWSHLCAQSLVKIFHTIFASKRKVLHCNQQAREAFSLSTVPASELILYIPTDAKALWRIIKVHRCHTFGNFEEILDVTIFQHLINFPEVCQNFHSYGTRNALCTLHDMYATCTQLNQNPACFFWVAAFGKSLCILCEALSRWLNLGTPCKCQTSTSTDYLELSIAYLKLTYLFHFSKSKLD